MGSTQDGAALPPAPGQAAADGSTGANSAATATPATTPTTSQSANGLPGVGGPDGFGGFGKTFLTEPVGRGQTNQPDDVHRASSFLADNGILPGPTRDADEGFLRGIEKGQEKLNDLAGGGLRVDGIAKPWGPTEMLSQRAVTSGKMAASAPSPAKPAQASHPSEGPARRLKSRSLKPPSPISGPVKTVPATAEVQAKPFIDPMDGSHGEAGASPRRRREIAHNLEMQAIRAEIDKIGRDVLAKAGPEGFKEWCAKLAEHRAQSAARLQAALDRAMKPKQLRRQASKVMTSEEEGSSPNRNPRPTVLEELFGAFDDFMRDPNNGPTETPPIDPPDAGPPPPVPPGRPTNQKRPRISAEQLQRILQKLLRPR